MLHRLLLVAFLLCVAPASVRAHFLFLRILPPAEGGRAAEVYFSEYAEAGDPTFINKIAHTRVWLQETPSKFEPLKVHKGTDRLRAHVASPGSIVVVGACEYGVIARAKKVPFLLRHYPKALAGKPEELNRMEPCKEVPLEIMATLEGERIGFVVLRGGKPLPKAELNTVAADLTGVKFTADGDGKASWQPPAPGRYSVYTSHFTQEAGEAGGKKYEEIRTFATISFTWPLERKGADPKAVALFEEALAARGHWQNFPGFRARVEGTLDGRPFHGKVTLDAHGAVELDMEELPAQRWLTEQLESIALHRGVRPQGGSATRPKPELRFADHQEDHPLGRLLIFEGGKFASSYRVKDQQIMVVNRNVGPLNMTITVLDNDRNPDGKFLPHSYTVQYWDAATGELRRTETVQQRWQRLGTWDLPSLHSVTTASEAGLSVRVFRLSKHEVLEGK